MLQTNDDSDRGQVGIGTLIIFIALVLVAAVAAGVLVNTAGELQAQASDTGDDAQAQVGNQIEVVSATGKTNTNETGVENVTLVVKKSAGSDPIDLSDATIEYTSSGSSETLTHDVSLSGTSFTTEGIDGGDSEVLQNSSDRIKITISTSDIEGDLMEGQRAELQITDQSGASTIYGVNVPDVIYGDYVNV